VKKSEFQKGGIDNFSWRAEKNPTFLESSMKNGVERI